MQHCVRTIDLHMVRIVFLLAVAFVALGACRPPSPSLTSEEQAIITDEVSETIRNYYADVRANGLLAETNYLDSSEHFFWVPPGYSSAISYDSVLGVLKQKAVMFRSIDNRLDTLRVVPLSLDLATYSARIHSRMVDTSGGESAFTLMETGLFIRREQGWKLFSGQTAILP